MRFNRFFKKSAVLVLSTAMLGSVFFAAPAAAVSAVGDDDSLYQEYGVQYVYDNDLLMLDPDEKNGTMNICGYYGNEPYLIIPERIAGYDVVSIGDSAFYNKNIRGIIIPEGVKVIQNRAFKYCRNLEQIRIPKSVTSIGEETFQFCDSLESISLPDSVTSMGEGAFSFCISMKSFTFPKGMNNIPDRVLEFNDALTEINMHDGITSVGNYAFWHNKELETVKIPPSVKTIGESALACNDKLKEVKLPPDLETIPNSLVAECSSLEHFTIPELVSKIEDYAFYRCPSLKSLTVPMCTREIGDYAIGFDQGEPDWTKKIVDNFVLSGATGSFAYAYAAENNIPFEPVQEDSQYDYNEIHNYENYDDAIVIIKGYHGKETDIVIPHYINGKPVKRIDERAFENSDITSLYVHSGVESIGEFAFAHCTSLESVYLCEGISSIGACAFEDCTALKDVRLPSDMTQWNEYHDGGQFSGCSSLERIVIPKNITWVGPFTFSLCTSLEDIVFPEHIDSIGHAAFEETAWLVNQPAGAVYIGDALYVYKNDYISESAVSVKEGTKYIAVTAFVDSEMTSVSFPQGLEDIDMMAFFNCRKLTSVTIPDTVTRIGERALGWNTDQFYPDSQNIRTQGFMIIGKSGTEAERYAKDNGFMFYDPDKTLSNGSFVSSTDITFGETVTLNAVAEGGMPDYTYAFMYKAPGAASWKVIGTKFGTSDKETFKPTKAGNYEILISVKDSTGKTEAKKFSLTVKDNKLANKSSVSGTDVPCGTKITITGAAEGGEGTYLYTYQIKKPGKTSWTTLGEKYGTDTSKVFTAKISGAYEVRVLVKDGAGTVKSFTATVNSTGTLLKNKSTISTTTATVGDKVTLAAVPDGGTAPYRFTYEYKKPGSTSWKTIGKRGATYKSVSFNIEKTGTYQARVYIQDASDYVTVKTFKVTVT